MIIDFLSWCPGVFGLLLRQKLYPFWLKECGKNVLFGRFVKIKGAKNICIGNNVVINDWAVLDAENKGSAENGIKVEDNVFIGAGTILKTSGGDILLRKNVNIGSECRIASEKKTVIESDVLLAAFCQIGNSEQEKEEIDNEVENMDIRQKKNEIKIGCGCWLGVRAIIRSGVMIGDGTIIGAHGVVENDLPSNIVAVGNPAVLLYSRL